ncbi:MAG: phage recombination protein Bet [Alkalibacterium sp.]|nr:phage recombination protein Bet [Alkalibacterium sp.]
MSNQLMEKEVTFEVNGESVKLTGATVKNYLVSGNGEVSDQELVMFINLCKYQKLNPFLNEAYLVKFGSQPAQIIVSKEAFMKRAESHKLYDGFDAGIIVERENDLVEIEGAVKLSKDKLIGGWAKVYRKDRDKPIVVKISLEEFGKGQATWKAMPLNMIRKTAIVNAMREAFPDNVGAMYTEEEAPASPQPRNIEAELEEEVTQNANQKVVDFEQSTEPKENKPRKTAEPVKEDSEPEQGTVFGDPDF